MRLSWRRGQKGRAPDAAARESEIERELISSSPAYGVPGGPTVPTMDPSTQYPNTQKFPGAYHWDRPFAYTVPQPPYKRPEVPVTTDTLVLLAERCDIIRDCISHLQREVSNTPLTWVPLHKGDDSEQTQRELKECLELFSPESPFFAELNHKKGDPSETRQEFEYELINDLCTVGSACVWFEQNRAGKPTRVQAINAATIRPRVNIFGWPPENEPHYEQWIGGVTVASFLRKSMIYDGVYPISSSPYFQSPLQWILTPTESLLRIDQWNLAFFTDGNTVDMMFEAPLDWTPDQYVLYQTYIDDMVKDDVRQRRKAKMLPPGVKPHSPGAAQQEMQFGQFQQLLIKRICATFGVHPASLGFEGTQYAVSQERSMDATHEFGAGVIRDWLARLYTRIARVMGYNNVRAMRDTPPTFKPAEKAQVHSRLVQNGIMSINEARDEWGKGPRENGDNLMVTGLLRPLEQVVNSPLRPFEDPHGMKTDPAFASAGPTVDSAGQGSASQDKTAGGANPDETAVDPDNVKGSSPRAEQRHALREEDARAIEIARSQRIMLDAPAVYLIRHGHTNYNSDDCTSPDRVRGWKDVPLSEKGIRQAQMIASRCTALYLTDIECSDLKRAEQTAQLIADGSFLSDIKTTDEWRPWNMGDLQGRQYADVLGTLEDYIRNRPDEPIPGGESFNQFKNRFLTALRRRLRALKNGEEKILGIVTHSRNLKLAEAWLANGSLDNQIDLDVYFRNDCRLGEVNQLVYDSGRWQAIVVG